MNKCIAGFVVALGASFAGACVVGDESDRVLDEGQLEEGEQVQYSAGTCGIVWYAPDTWYRLVSASSFSECDHRAGELGNEHCDELRGGAPGPNPLFIEFRYTDADGGYQDGWKDYYCEGVPRR